MSDYFYRKGKMIVTNMKYHCLQCYIGQYYDQHTALLDYPIWIDLCFDTQEHIYGYTLFGIKSNGIELCDLSEHICQRDNLPYGKIKVVGVDEV
jgi:hypothetical protein